MITAQTTSRTAWLNSPRVPASHRDRVPRQKKFDSPLFHGFVYGLTESERTFLLELELFQRI